MKLSKILTNALRRRTMDYVADGVGVWGKNLGFMNDPKFAAAWEKSRQMNVDGWVKRKRGVPDVIWRAHIACWAAQRGLSLAGDFVECGVHSGLLSVTIAEFLDFAKQPKKFYLFDTFSGLPEEALKPEEAGKRNINDRKYFDVYEIAKRNFAPYPNMELVRGILPDTLSAIDGKQIAYLSIDLNNMIGEKAVIERLWRQITPGAVIVLDDYGFAGHQDQHRMWNDFARTAGSMVATLPTGQGLIIR
jgi:O-methyltransferase